jgi:ribose transport system substrate-binding protein
MRFLHINRTRAALGSLVFVALAATACSSSSSTSSAGGGTATTSSPVTASTAATGSADTGSVAGLTAAKQAIAPYTGHPSPFPATEKLAKLPTPGSKFVFLQCGAPVCAIFSQLMPAPAKALGVNFVAVNSGNTATTAQAGAAAALADKPAAVLVGASNPQLYGDYLHKLVSAGSVVAGGGTVGGASYGVQHAVGGAQSVANAGEVLADWVTVNKGSSANVVFFGTPELTFSTGMQAAFQQTLTQNCPGCKADYQQLSIATFGTTAPSQVVSYLQSHPSVNTVVFASMEGATGLAAALKDAHLSPTTLGFAPTASNLQDIADGGLTAGLALDFNVQVWMQLNLAARLIAHQTTSQSNLEVDMQFLAKSDLQGVNVSHGWTGYPDVAQRFAALWGTTK